MMPIITPFPSPKSRAKEVKLCAKEERYMMKDMAIPATKQVMLEDTFLAYRVTKGMEIA
jgi:hypothetical protein